MRFQSRCFRIAKDAETPAWYDDASDFDAEHGRAAIADGVAQTIFAGEWARIVTRGAVADPPDLEDVERFQAWLSGLREAWSEEVARKIAAKPLAWWQQPKMLDGAMCTLLWVVLSPLDGEEVAPGTCRLESFAIGDSCLFHVRGGELLRSFPIEDSSEFDLMPAVIGSLHRNLDHVMEFKAVDDHCLPGDLLVLCTDALAQWAVVRQEAGSPVDWEVYWDMPAEAWEEEIAALRSEHQMRYDDTTLLLLRVVAETAAPVAAPSELVPVEEAPAELVPVEEAAVEEAAVEEPVAGLPDADEPEETAQAALEEAQDECPSHERA